MNDMNLAYYPGCTLDTSAKEINESLHQVCDRLSIHLRELPDWNCCGSSSVHAVRPQLAVSLAARNLFQAQTFDSELMVMCAGCMNRLRVAEYHLRESPTTIRVNEEIFGNRLKKPLRVRHLLDIIPSRLQEATWSHALQKPLFKLRYVPYYGCLLAKPPELRHYPKLHRSMESVMKWMGAEEVAWSYHAKCCGSFLSVARPDIVNPMVSDIMEMAISSGAECIITACAMCQLNLELRARKEQRLPVFSIMELLAYGLGSEDWPGWFDQHMIDPMPLFDSKGFCR